MPVMPATLQLNVRISEKGRDILNELQERWGISQRDVVEMLLRDRARELGLDLKNVKTLNNIK